MKHETRSGCLVLMPRNRIDSSNAKAFEDEAMKLVDGSAGKVILDLSDLSYISSAGLRVLLTTAKKAKAAGGGMTLANVRDSVGEVIKVSGFDTIFGLHASVDAAIASLGGN
jgi:anti-anti-sigma factor